MADNNEIIKALGQVPELVETTKKVLEDNDKKFKILADATQKRMQAEIPYSEIKKISDAAGASVAHTKCASPDTDEVSRLVAGNISRFLAKSLKEIAIEAVKEAVADTPVTVEHHHTHTTLGYMCKMAEATLRNWIIGLACGCWLLVCAILYLCFANSSNPARVGQQYYDVYCSKYTTNSEREALKEGCYSVSILPKEFDKNPRIVKSKLRRNKQIIKQRKAEARVKKGVYSTTPALER